MAATKTKKKTASANKRVNKSAWIRKQPAGMSAKDVVAKAKGEGIKLSISQVYTARSSAKRAGAIGPTRAAAGRTAVGDEATFRKLVMAIGVRKAETLLTEFKRSVGL